MVLPTTHNTQQHPSVTHSLAHLLFLDSYPNPYSEPVPSCPPWQIEVIEVAVGAEDVVVAAAEVTAVVEAMAAFEAAEVAETEDAEVETPAASEVEDEENTEGAATLEDVATLEDEATLEVVAEVLTVVEEEGEAVVVAAEEVEDSVINRSSSRMFP